ncbi:hypothetical protein KY348_05600 [Candidatus Woesearchaeota archaeon]|nr:hypothetical protein [Candidatus Woesearchaeota archaeon]
MMDSKELLDKRTRAKKKKPVFVRRAIHKKKRIGSSWRRPRGLHNKQRLKRRGYLRSPGTGYKAPAKIRGAHRTGLIPVLVSNTRQLAGLTKEHGIILSSKLGDNKRKSLVEEIKKQGLTLLNLDADKTLAGIENKLRERKEEKRKKAEKRKAKKKGIEEKVKKEELKKKEEIKKEEEVKKKEETEKQEEVKKKAAEKKEAELSDEEKKKLEKQEKDKLLTKRT